MAIKKFTDQNITQSSKPTLIIGSKLQPKNDAFYGPYDSVEDAHLSIVGYMTYKGATAKAIPLGLEVGVIEGDKIVEYWYERTKQPSEEYTVEDLVKKNVSSTNMKFKDYSDKEYKDYD